MRDMKPLSRDGHLNTFFIDAVTGSRMTSYVKSSSLEDFVGAPVAGKRGVPPNGWLKVGAIAAASVLLGGMAAAWFYRKTLSQLREAENEIRDSESRAIEDEWGDS